MRSHNGGENISMWYLWKAFIIHCGLSRHKRNHSGHEILQCDICENGFTVYSYLTRHKGSSSGEKLFRKYGQVETLSHL